jgi:phosphoadenylyl-sulfate reductase (thioredoxin)
LETTFAFAGDAAAPEEVLTWAADRFAGRIVFATGFGAEGCVLIDLIARLRLPIDLITLDTGLFFDETVALWRRLERRYGVTIRAVRPARTVDEQARIDGPELWRRDPDRCCELRKVEPLRAALAGYDAWIAAVRRDQTPARAGIAVVERDPRFGLVKVSPLAAWTDADVWAHIQQHDVPHNPLHARGYPSIGCRPCTSPVALGENPRAGRWRGQSKTECGLHDAALPAGRAAAPPRSLPAFLRLEGRPVVLVGGGRVAAAKLGPLLESGAQVRVVAPTVGAEVRRPGVEVVARAFEPGDLDGAWFVVAAATPDVNRAVVRAASERRLFVNAVDDAETATAYAGGVVHRDGVVVAISTEGRAPALAGLMREALQDLLPQDLEAWADRARRLRAEWKERGVPISRRRPLLLDALNRLYARETT